jgi:hypothetical protein
MMARDGARIVKVACALPQRAELSPTLSCHRKPKLPKG